jgi:hypothetical protein
MKDAKGSLVMWRQENMKLVWIFQYFGLGLIDNGLWEYFKFLGCLVFPSYNWTHDKMFFVWSISHHCRTYPKGETICMPICMYLPLFM